MAPRYLAVPSGSCDVKVKHSLQEFAQVILTHFLITMNIKRFLMIIAIPVILSTYSRCTDISGGDEEFYNLIYTNNSLHNVTINRTDFSTYNWVRVLPETIELPANSTYEVKNVLSPMLCSAFGNVVFDGEITIFYAKTQNHDYNITMIDNYQYRGVKRRVHYYTYTFTDADYQFALENGTKLGE